MSLQEEGYQNHGDTNAEHRPKPRGFAAMDPERRKEIARRGGQNAQARGTAHTFNTEEAKEAGRKGGKAKKKRP